MDPVELALVQGKTRRLQLAWRQPDTSYLNFSDWDFYSQIREKEDPTSTLILDLKPFFTIADDTPGDGKYLVLDLPGSATAGLSVRSFGATKNPSWDVFIVNKTDRTVDELVIQGPVTLDPSATDMTAAEA